jgi:hypothetical protein
MIAEDGDLGLGGRDQGSTGRFGSTSAFGAGSANQNIGWRSNPPSFIDPNSTGSNNIFMVGSRAPGKIIVEAAPRAGGPTRAALDGEQGRQGTRYTLTDWAGLPETIVWGRFVEAVITK